MQTYNSLAWSLERSLWNISLLKSKGSSQQMLRCICPSTIHCTSTGIQDRKGSVPSEAQGACRFFSGAVSGMGFTINQCDSHYHVWLFTGRVAIPLSMGPMGRIQKRILCLFPQRILPNLGLNPCLWWGRFFAIWPQEDLMLNWNTMNLCLKQIQWT